MANYVCIFFTPTILSRDTGSVVCVVLDYKSTNLNVNNHLLSHLNCSAGVKKDIMGPSQCLIFIQKLLKQKKIPCYFVKVAHKTYHSI